MKTEEFALSIPSSTENIHQVEGFIEEICDRYNLTGHYFGNISLAVLEAVDNAIIHGNRNNKDKSVKLILSIKPGQLEFKINDEGAGFDYSKVPDPTDPMIDIPEGIGRGLFIIRSMTDEVTFNDQGNEITMTFKISGISKKMIDERIKKMESYQSKITRKLEKH
jgi:serine/threonine-protein kinase RsbW